MGAGYFNGPDTYWSNESINGWVSRLAIDSNWTHAPLHGLPVEAAMLTIVLLFAMATTIVLLRAPGRPWEGAFALSLWLGVVWFTRLNGRWWLLVLGVLGVLGWLLIEQQAQLDGARETVYQASPGLAWLSSVGLYGALILGSVSAYVLLRPGSADRPADRHADRELNVGR